MGYGGSVSHAGRDEPAYVELRRGKAVTGSAFAKSYGTTRRIPDSGLRSSGWRFEVLFFDIAGEAGLNGKRVRARDGLS